MPKMLPALPSTFGRLTDVFVSALGSITGSNNRLEFPRSRRVCVVMVDGLGSHNLKAAGGHAPFLNSALARNKSISCGFPSTTATSLTSFATGLVAGEHRLIGYQVYERSQSRSANLLTGWGDLQEPEKWQPALTVSETAFSAGIQSYVIGPPEYEGSGFTRVTMRGARYLGAKSISDRIDKAKQLLHAKPDCLIYLYVPELDQAAHAFGTDSPKWLQRVEELDSAMAKLTNNLPKSSAVALTADHGIVNVPRDNQIYLDEYLAEQDVTYVGGDPRVSFLYLTDQQSAGAIGSVLESKLGDMALVLGLDEIKRSALYRSMSDDAAVLLPELMILSKKRIALYHRRFAKPQSLNMVGQHGSLSMEEMTIPLLRWGDYA